MKTIDVKTRIAIKNIAFATDLSPASYAALPFAAEFARFYGAKVWGFHVFSPKVYPVPPSLVLPRSSHGVSRELGAKSPRHSARSRDRLRGDLGRSFCLHREKQHRPRSHRHARPDGTSKGSHGLCGGDGFSREPMSGLDSGAQSIKPPGPARRNQRNIVCNRFHTCVTGSGTLCDFPCAGARSASGFVACDRAAQKT